PEAALLLVIVGRSWAPDVAAAAALTTKPLAEAEDAGVLGPAELRALLAPPHRVDVAGRGDLDAIETPTACRPTRFLGPASGVRRSLLGRGPDEAAFAQLAPALPFLSVLTTPDDVAHLVDAEAFGAVRRCHGCPSLSERHPEARVRRVEHFVVPAPAGTTSPARQIREGRHLGMSAQVAGPADAGRSGCRGKYAEGSPTRQGCGRSFDSTFVAASATFSPRHHRRCPERRLPNRWDNPRGLFTTAG